MSKSQNKKGIRKWIILGILFILAAVIVFSSIPGNETSVADISKQSKFYEKSGQKVLIILYTRSGNTRKIAAAIAEEMGAFILEPGETSEINEDLDEYDIIGFGSGIYSEKHHQLLLDLVEKLPNLENKRAFIFSTCGIYTEDLMESNHKPLRDILLDKGFTIAGEFSCPGLNKNSFLKLFGGINKNRPNSEDIKNAQNFAKGLLMPDERNK